MLYKIGKILATGLATVCAGVGGYVIGDRINREIEARKHRAFIRRHTQIRPLEGFSPDSIVYSHNCMQLYCLHWHRAEKSSDHVIQLRQQATQRFADMFARTFARKDARKCVASTSAEDASEPAVSPPPETRENIPLQWSVAKISDLTVGNIEPSIVVIKHMTSPRIISISNQAIIDATRTLNYDPIILDTWMPVAFMHGKIVLVSPLLIAAIEANIIIGGADITGAIIIAQGGRETILNNITFPRTFLQENWRATIALMLENDHNMTVRSYDDSSSEIFWKDFIAYNIARLSQE